MMRSVGICALAWLLHGCIGQPACTDSGGDLVLIPVTRLLSVASLSADGACSVAPVPADCSTAAWCGEWRGEQTAGVRVTSTAKGKCTVTVDFNDGCSSESRSYEFVGSHDNCCEDICSKRLPA